MDGALPESFHSTEKAPPAGNDAPAAGVVNCTSARAKGASAARRDNRSKRMIVENVSRKYCEADLEGYRNMVSGREMMERGLV